MLKPLWKRPHALLLLIALVVVMGPATPAEDCTTIDDDCDGFDDDCDGFIDEDFVSGTTTCGVGECAGNTGLAECSPVVVYGANRNANMWRIDLGAQDDSLDGSLFFGTQAMELDRFTGRIYYYEWRTSGNEFGYYDPQTAENVVVRTYSPPLGIYGKRMAQAPDGTMFLGDQNNNLITIELETGDVAFFGTIQGLEIGDFGATGDLVFAPDGTLWAVNYEAVSTIDLTTLQATELADNLIDLPGINIFTGAAYCHGTLYASAVQESTGLSGIYRIDPFAGTAEELWLAGDYLNDLSSCASDGAPPFSIDTCDPFAGATAEICDGLDNDCDGSVDEDGVCSVTCQVDADCDDGLHCNGLESCGTAGDCQAGTPPLCDDGVACTADSCDESGDTCLHTPVDSVCDDGLHCNGLETCDTVADCQAGTPPLCDDGVACTADSCDESGDTCLHTPVDSVCDDGFYCSGTESCDPLAGCQSSGDPCSGAGVCDEATDSCAVQAGGVRLFLSFESGSGLPWALGAEDCSSGDSVAEAFASGAIGEPQFTGQGCRSGGCLAVAGRQALALDGAGIVDPDSGSFSLHFRATVWQDAAALVTATDVTNDALGLSMSRAGGSSHGNGPGGARELSADWVDDLDASASAASDIWGSGCSLKEEKWYWASCSYDRVEGRSCRLYEEKRNGWAERCSWSRTTPSPLPALDVPLLGVGNPLDVGGVAFLLDNVVFSDDPAFDHTTLRELDAAPAGLCLP